MVERSPSRGRRAGLATVFPQSIGMAASFDDDLLYKVFDAVSDEARAKNRMANERGSYRRYQGLTFWTPNVNIFRDPRWGRGQETYGEDPYLSGRMGVAVVRGIQGPNDTKWNKAHACAKHFAVHSVRSGADTASMPRTSPSVNSGRPICPPSRTSCRRHASKRSCAPTTASRETPAAAVTDCSTNPAQ